MIPSSPVNSIWDLLCSSANNMWQVLHLLFPLKIKFRYRNSELPLELKKSVMAGVIVSDMWSIHIFVTGRRWNKLCEVLQSIICFNSWKTAFQLHRLFETLKHTPGSARWEIMWEGREERRIWREENMNEKKIKETLEREKKMV